MKARRASEAKRFTEIPNIGPAIAKDFGKYKVMSGPKYGKDFQFGDWIVQSGNKFYYFEIKSYQFAYKALHEATPGDIAKELDKVAAAIKQVRARLADINKFAELKKFRKKEPIPIIVFNEMPFVSGGLFAKQLQDMLGENGGNAAGTNARKVFLINIDELELYDAVRKKISLEALLLKVEGNPATGLLTEMFKLNKDKGLINRLLKKRISRFQSELKSSFFHRLINSVRVRIFRRL